jgi:hypothetical protein
MEWCLAITGSIVTAVIIAVFLHPAFLPGFTRVFLCVLLSSAGFGLWAKFLMAGDKPEIVSLRSPQIEELLQKIRPKISNFTSLSALMEERKRVGNETIKQMGYIQFKWFQMLGKVYKTLTCCPGYAFLGQENATPSDFEKLFYSKPS